MTFNACMKKHFDEAFGPYGFKKLKSKYPYWGRMIGDEILQIITYKNEWSMKPYKDFSIWGGVATVYRKKIDLDISPKDQDWIIDARDFFRRKNSDFEEIQKKTGCSNNLFLIGNDENMIDRVRNAVNLFLKYMMPEFERINNIQSCYDFFVRHNGVLLNVLRYKTGERLTDENEGIIQFDMVTIDEYIDRKEKVFEEDNKKWLKVFKNNSKDNYLEIYQRDYERRKEFKDASIDAFKYVMTHNEMREKYHELMRERKKMNLEYLDNKGIIF